MCVFLTLIFSAAFAAFSSSVAPSLSGMSLPHAANISTSASSIATIVAFSLNKTTSNLSFQHPWESHCGGDCCVWLVWLSLQGRGAVEPEGIRD